MRKKQVSFILPDNNVHHINYEEVEEYCKSICLSDCNKDEFLEFSKNYTYFTPYFDFVMFKLNYIFVNANFSGMQGLFHIDNALYLYPIRFFDYNSLFKEAKEAIDFSSTLPFMTSVSDTELDIAKSSPIDTGDVIIDPNLYGMMSKSGTIDGSHGVTSASVLNQLLIKSQLICNTYYDYTSYEPDLFLDPINYLVKNLGFLRATSIEVNPMLIGNMYVLEEMQKNFIDMCENNFYRYCDIEDDEAKSYIKEYKSMIKKGF